MRKLFGLAIIALLAAIAAVGMSRAASTCKVMHSSMNDRVTRASVATSANLNLVFWNPKIGFPKASLVSV